MCACVNMAHMCICMYVCVCVWCGKQLCKRPNQECKRAIILLTYNKSAVIELYFWHLLNCHRDINLLVVCVCVCVCAFVWLVPFFPNAIVACGCNCSNCCVVTMPRIWVKDIKLIYCFLNACIVCAHAHTHVHMYVCTDM